MGLWLAAAAAPLPSAVSAIHASRRRGGGL